RKRFGERRKPANVGEQNRKPLFFTYCRQHRTTGKLVRQLEVFFIEHQTANLYVIGYGGLASESDFRTEVKSVGQRLLLAVARRAVLDSVDDEDSAGRTARISPTGVRMRNPRAERNTKNSFIQPGLDLLFRNQVRDVWHDRSSMVVVAGVRCPGLGGPPRNSRVICSQRSGNSRVSCLLYHFGGSAFVCEAVDCGHPVKIYLIYDDAIIAESDRRDGLFVKPDPFGVRRVLRRRAIDVVADDVPLWTRGPEQADRSIR